MDEWEPGPHIRIRNSLVYKMMKENHNMIEQGSTLAIEQKECWIPNNMFLALYVAGIVGMILLALSGTLNPKASTGLITLTIVYGLFGSLMFFKKISIVRCPSKVLLGAAVFIGITAFIDKYFI